MKKYYLIISECLKQRFIKKGINMPQLICEDVTLGYEGNAVTENLSFSVSSGDYLCIVGENGAGKSTLIKALLGLIRPMKGRIYTGDSLKASEIGYLPQQTVVQRDFPASVREIVYSGLAGKKGFFYSKEDKLQASRQMEKMGIKHLEKRCYRELSGGQQQRVLLARALSATEKMLLLDEPAGGLDMRTKEEMYELISRLNREDKITVIMVTHDMPAAVKYASHILHLSHRPLFCGKKEDYLKSDAWEYFNAIGGGESR